MAIYSKNISTPLVQISIQQRQKQQQQSQNFPLSCVKARPGEGQITPTSCLLAPTNAALVYLRLWLKHLAGGYVQRA